MRIILLGAPGSGKGTQAAKLVEKYNYGCVSTGSALRSEISLKTKLGEKVSKIMSAGKLVSDEVIYDVMLSEINRLNKENLIVDGFPRTLSQCESTDRILGTSDYCAIYLKVKTSVLVDRLTGRKTCSNCGQIFHDVNRPSLVADKCDVCGGKLEVREDDKPQSVVVRMKVYEEDTAPVIGYFRDRKKLHEINGERSSGDIFEEICKFISEV